MSSHSGTGAQAQRRELSRRARDAFPPMGVYAIRDRSSGRVLVGSSRNVFGTMNRIRFELRLGSHPNKSLQAEWNRHGADRFSFEVLELLKERDDAAFDYAAELRSTEELYREELGAEAAPK